MEQARWEAAARRCFQRMRLYRYNQPQYTFWLNMAGRCWDRADRLAQQ